MDFPRLVFIVPGKEALPHRRSYSHLLVETPEEFDAAIAEGFFETLPEALEADENPEKVAELRASIAKAKEDARLAAEQAEKDRVDLEAFRAQQAKANQKKAEKAGA